MKQLKNILAHVTPMTWFVILLVITYVLVFSLPPSHQAVTQLHTTSTKYRLAELVLLMPYTVVWYASFYAYGKLSEYAVSLKGSVDGRAFRKISIGVGVLAFGLIIPTALGQILNYVAAHHPGFNTASSLLQNYMTLVMALLSFLIVNYGTHALMRTVKNHINLGSIRWLALPYILLTVLFTHLTMTNYYARNLYHMNLPVLTITYITPYLYVWLLGLLCTYELWLYATYVKGAIYRHALKQFAIGIAIAIGADIIIQFAEVTLTQRVSKSLGLLLIADYVLIVILAIGLTIMAFGTKQLKKIEEV